MSLEIIFFDTEILIAKLLPLSKTLVFEYWVNVSLLDEEIYHCIKVDRDVFLLFGSDENNRYDLYEYHRQKSRIHKVSVKGYRPLRKINPKIIFDH